MKQNKRTGQNRTGIQNDEAVPIREEVEKTFVRFLKRGEPPHDYERQLLIEHFDRVLYILEGGSPPPYELEIQPSASCNLRCKHCFGRFYDPLPFAITEKEMGDLAKKVADFEEDGFGIEVAKFCGTTGEPLINPATAQGIKIFKSYGKKVIVFTNGLWLDERCGNNGELFLDAVLEADKLVLSLDAGSDETFSQLKGIDGFRRVVQNLENLIRKRSTCGSRLHVAASYVIGSTNYGDVPEAARKARESGVNEIRFRVDFTDIGAIRQLAATIEQQIEQAMQYSGNGFKVVSIYSKQGISENDSEFQSYGRRCFNHHFWACVGPDYELYACGHRTHSGVDSYGSFSHCGFPELWHGNKRAECVKALPDDHCKICSPSSARRNDFMTWLSGVPIGEVKELHRRYIGW